MKLNSIFMKLKRKHPDHQRRKNDSGMQPWVYKAGEEQWRNVAPVFPAGFAGGAMKRGRQNYELKVFGSKNVPYVGQLNIRW